jgi:hypothetical protein
LTLKCLEPAAVEVQAVRSINVARRGRYGGSMGDGIEQQGSGTTATERLERVAERVFGGWALIIGGVLLFGAQFLIALLPAPPAAPSGLARWVQEYAFPLSMSDELLFFAIVCLTPGVVVLFRTTRFRRPVSSLLGCSSLLLAMTLLGVLVVVGGRLVYPVFGISLLDDVIALVVSLFFGGLHAVLLFMGVGLIAASFALRQENAWRRLPIASIGAGALQVLGSYPWLTPAWVNVTTAAALFAWMLAAGWWLRSARS